MSDAPPETAPVDGLFAPRSGPAFEPCLLGAAAMLTLGLILYWMYPRKLFVKV